LIDKVLVDSLEDVDEKPCGGLGEGNARVAVDPAGRADDSQINANDGVASRSQLLCQIGERVCLASTAASEYRLVIPRGEARKESTHVYEGLR
jgi:hypothetical protein